MQSTVLGTGCVTPWNYVVCSQVGMAVKRKTHNQAFSSCDRSCNGSKQAAVMRMDCERWDGRVLLHGKSGKATGNSLLGENRRS